MGILGLMRNVVQVVEHQPEWQEAFEAEYALLKSVIGDVAVDIQHVGSTSVIGLRAKPILDIAVAVSSLEVVPDIIERLVQHGYLYRGDSGQSGGHLLVKECRPDVRTEHLHIVDIEDLQWRNYLRFRDTLRENPTLRMRYAELKDDLAQKYTGDRKSYTDGKHEFIQEVLNTEEK